VYLYRLCQRDGATRKKINTEKKSKSCIKDEWTIVFAVAFFCVRADRVVVLWPVSAGHYYGIVIIMACTCLATTIQRTPCTQHTHLHNTRIQGIKGKPVGRGGSTQTCTLLGDRRASSNHISHAPQTTTTRDPRQGHTLLQHATIRLWPCMRWSALFCPALPATLDPHKHTMGARPRQYLAGRLGLARDCLFPPAFVLFLRTTRRHQQPPTPQQQH